MEYRNAKFVRDGWINCEINHPQYGWIPFTANPADTGAQFDVAALHAAMSADSATQAYVPEPPPPPPPAPTLTDLMSRLQELQAQIALLQSRG